MKMSSKKKEFIKVPVLSGEAAFPVSNENGQESCAETRRSSSRVSKNLKGGFIRELRMAARMTRVAVAEMAKRTTATGDAQELEEANLRLRAEVHGLREEIGTLRVEIECLRRRSAHRPATPAPFLHPNGETTQPVPLSLPEALTTGVRGVKEVRREVEVGGGSAINTPPNQRQRQLDGESLMERIETLIDRKLAALRNEMFPGRSVRPPLGVRTGDPETEKKGKKDGKERATEVERWKAEEEKKEKDSVSDGVGSET